MLWPWGAVGTPHDTAWALRTHPGGTEPRSGELHATPHRCCCCDGAVRECCWSSGTPDLRRRDAEEGSFTKSARLDST